MQPIIPAPVRSRRALTSWALTCTALTPWPPRSRQLHSSAPRAQPRRPERTPPPRPALRSRAPAGPVLAGPVPPAPVPALPRLRPARAPLAVRARPVWAASRLAVRAQPAQDWASQLAVRAQPAQGSTARLAAPGSRGWRRRRLRRFRRLLRSRLCRRPPSGWRSAFCRCASGCRRLGRRRSGSLDSGCSGCSRLGRGRPRGRPVPRPRAWPVPQLRAWRAPRPR